MEWLALVAYFFLLGIAWVVIARVLSRYSKSKIISIGGGFLILMLALGMVGAFLEDIDERKSLRAAREAGFSTTEEHRKALSLGLSTKQEMTQYDEEQLHLSQRRIQDQQRLAKEQQAQEDARRKAEEERCKEDLQCLGDKESLAAAIKCDDYIERLAKYDFEWTDGILAPKFSHFKWKDKKEHVLTYIGDKVKFQNGFGAWQYFSYECDFNTRAGQVVDARAYPGRLLP